MKNYTFLDHQTSARTPAGTSNSDPYVVMLTALRSTEKDPYLKRKIDFFAWAYTALKATPDTETIEHRHLKQMTSLVARQVLEEIQATQSPYGVN